MAPMRISQVWVRQQLLRRRRQRRPQTNITSDQELISNSSKTNNGTIWQGPAMRRERPEKGCWMMRGHQVRRMQLKCWYGFVKNALLNNFGFFRRQYLLIGILMGSRSCRRVHISREWLILSSKMRRNFPKTRSKRFANNLICHIPTLFRRKWQSPRTSWSPRLRPSMMPCKGFCEIGNFKAK